MVKFSKALPGLDLHLIPKFISWVGVNRLSKPNQSWQFKKFFDFCFWIVINFSVLYELDGHGLLSDWLHNAFTGVKKLGSRLEIVWFQNAFTGVKNFIHVGKIFFVWDIFKKKVLQAVLIYCRLKLVLPNN